MRRSMERSRTIRESDLNRCTWSLLQTPKIEQGSNGLMLYEAINIVVVLKTYNNCHKAMLSKSDRIHYYNEYTSYNRNL